MLDCRHFALALALSALNLLGCPGPSKCDPGRACADAGQPDAGPTFCAPQGSPCASSAACCGNLSCTNGSCAEATPPACAAFGAPCSETQPCCVTPPPDGGWPTGSVPPNPGCFAIDGGLSVCFIGEQIGDPCSASTWGCANELVCTKGSCALPSTGQQCPSSRDGGQCLPGDDCTNAINTQNPTDPCSQWGLDCLAGTTSYLCLEPEVLLPPSFPAAQELTQTYSVCAPGLSDCQPSPGDTAPVTCGTFFNEGNPQISVCLETCKTGDDCGSLALDCVNGQCVPNYCYAEADQVGTDVAGIISSYQGTTVATDPKTLFQPCAHGGPNTVCLPQNDNVWNTTTAICYRVGAASAGGVGASCDPSGARSNLGALCQSGTLCY
ncbi:MAG: hypothetical protein ACYCWW_18300, partial [Deltaproteobacteria bacterium]